MQLPNLRHARAGRLEATRALARLGGVTGESAVVEVPLVGGECALGPLRLSLGVEGDSESATWVVRVQNASPDPIELEAVGIGWRWTPPAASGGLRFLRQGHQSWSFAGGAALDDVGAPRFPSGAWLRGFHHGVGEPPADRAGWHEADGVTAAEAGPEAACAAGALETGRAFGVVYLRRDGDAVRIELEQRFERILDPGEAVEAEAVRVALGQNAQRLLEAHATEQGARAGARTSSAFRAGWCSWYQFFHDVDEESFLRNLDALAAARREIPIGIVQLDDGYQRAIGDWLDTNSRFPGGLPALAKAVSEAGFRPGLWTAPFCVAPDSAPYREHPEWLLRSGGEPLRGLHHAKWHPDGWIQVLDPSHPEVCAHLERTFRTLVDMGFSYHKIDFLYTAALASDAADRRVTRAQRLRRGLEAIRAGIGDDAFLLGCGCPLGPAVGPVDAMRIGPDTAPHWSTLQAQRLPGLESTVPSGHNALRNTLSRIWMHRRLWVNDPDCLMVRSTDSELSRNEARALAASIAVSGGMVVVSDDMPALAAEDRAWARETVALAREVDASSQRGGARALGALDSEIAPVAVARAGADWLVAFFNVTGTVQRRSLELSGLGSLPREPSARPLLGSPAADVRDDTVSVELPPRSGALYRVAGAPALAVFCDFDGTFAVQDVGATLAIRHAGERRPALWERLRRGEFDAWQYNMELLDGLPLPESELEAFLRTVEEMPGARELIDWCEREAVPFRILSDGFDRNLDRLQELWDLRFAYDANHLHYESGVWRLAAGAPDPACSCGTGVCKRGRIEAFRSEHPGVPVAHVGNGRVSDLCGALAADRVFAKDTLAEELDGRGVDYEPFSDLHDVRAGLERWRASPDR